MKKIIIDEEGAGERIDKFLKEGFFLSEETTRGDIIRSIREGVIMVNEKAIKPSYILKEADEVVLNIVKEKEELIPNAKIQIAIVYQNDDFLIINKPAGLQVHPSDSEKEESVANALIVGFPEIKDINDGSQDSWMRPGIVHRLDKDTSGIMVVARNKKTFDELKRQFADREITKNYVALVYGNLENKMGVVDLPIARAASFKKQKIARGKTKGVARQAITEYNLLKRYAEFDFVEAIPKTGRMHQIRVHLASLGHPIVGDWKYRRKNIIQVAEVRRHLLHAQKLSFVLAGQQFDFIAELPDDFRGFLQGLDENQI
ncbi:MAG: RluA family pseudouridine synthase [Parcubacteria group bacterium]|jgi:23S rRNA pseudouridine1911/1915/1917 synthase